jgi:hypothetical protein
MIFAGVLAMMTPARIDDAMCWGKRRYTAYAASLMPRWRLRSPRALAGAAIQRGLIS